MKVFLGLAATDSDVRIVLRKPLALVNHVAKSLSHPIRIMKRLHTGLLLLAAILGPAAAFAEHEADHRYAIHGYVLDEQHRPLVRQRVIVVGLGSATTDADGAYAITLHLHNSDLGKKLQLRHGETERTIRVSFDPDDAHTPRVHHANFIGGEYVDGELDRGMFPVWGYAVAGIGLAAGGILYAAARRRRPRQAAAPSQPRKRRKTRRGKNKQRR